MNDQSHTSRQAVPAQYCTQGFFTQGGGQMSSGKILGGHLYVLQGGASQFSRGGGQINP